MITITIYKKRKCQHNILCESRPAYSNNYVVIDCRRSSVSITILACHASNFIVVHFFLITVRTELRTRDVALPTYLHDYHEGTVNNRLTTLIHKLGRNPLRSLKDVLERRQRHVQTPIEIRFFSKKEKISGMFLAVWYVW